MLKFFSFVISLLLFSTLVGQSPRDYRVHTVVIDPGHGGYDPGNLGTRRYSTTEKDIALAVSLKLGGYIKEHFPQVKVVYTRKTDKFVELKKRTEIANEAEADLFISVHCDAFTNNRVHGTTSFVMGLDHEDENMRVAKTENKAILLEENYEENYVGFDPSNPATYISLTMYQKAFLEQSINFAVKVQEQFRERVSRRDRGVKQQPLYVTSRTTMPSVLVELGFLTNPREEDFLNSENGQAYLASAIFRAFRAYKKERESFHFSTVDENQVATNGKGTNDTTTRGNSPSEPEIYYSVQIFTSGYEREKDDSVFEGLEHFAAYRERELYKYYTGKFQSKSKAQSFSDSLRNNGFSDCFVIALKDGELISLQEAAAIIQ